MNGGDSGSFNRLRYDRCAYEKDLVQSVEPLQMVMYLGKYENNSKCTYNENNNWRRFDDAIIKAENELKGISRRASNCSQFKYSPNCPLSDTCTSTFDDSVPVVLAQEVCPIIFNNIPKMTGPGYELDTETLCSRKTRNN